MPGSKHNEHQPRASKNSSSELSTESVRIPCMGHWALNRRKSAAEGDKQTEKSQRSEQIFGCNAGVKTKHFDLLLKVLPINQPGGIKLIFIHELTETANIKHHMKGRILLTHPHESSCLRIDTQVVFFFLCPSCAFSLASCIFLYSKPVENGIALF